MPNDTLESHGSGGAPHREPERRPAGDSALTTVTVQVNGEPVVTRAGTLAELLEERDFTGLRVATAMNGDFVPATRRAETRLNPGDRIEILSARQGG